MCNVLAETKVVIYVDDLLVGGRSQQEHNENLDKVFSKLMEARMHINEEKMQLGRKHVLFLGYDVGGGSYSLDCYVATQQKRLPSVSSRCEIRKILGIFNLFRSTCPGLRSKLGNLQTMLARSELPTGKDLTMEVERVWKYILNK